jgi:hypothetical protein
LTRRDLLLLAAQTAFAQGSSSADDLIHSFEAQGDHRTGTPVDNVSGDWLFEQVRRTGLIPARELFSLNRVDPVAGNLTIGARRIEGLPLFDCEYTDGITGKLGALNSDAPIGIGEAAPNTADTGAIGDARRQSKHKAIVLVTRGGRPGLCPNNADAFLRPFGPPVLQISSEDKEALVEGYEATLVASAKRTQSRAFNVTAQIRGADSSLPPLIVIERPET